ncbi:uncharacterized protein LOC144653411 isoform X2 [Oculina patagonica]
MLAPKALKSDKGQNTDRGPDGSSSEFSEDDTPLAVRLNSQGASRLNDAGRQRLRAALSKKGGFVIPRKKKQANELLQVSNFNAREGKELLRHVMQSYRDTAVGATFKFEKLELVSNDQLSREFQDKKQSMRNEWRNARELEDKYAFLYTVDRDEARRICEVGLEVGSASISCLGDPSMGVYLCRHADVISKKPLLLGALGYLIVFKVIKGKVKPVTERSAAAITDLLEPTPNFDCHVSRSVQSLPANSPLSQVFEYSQYYFYEFAEEGDDLHVKRPRQCLPYAVLTFTMVDSSAPHQEISVVQEELPNLLDNSVLIPPAPIIRHETRIPEKRRGRSSHVIWMGKIANKDRILANAQLVCHSVQKIKPPFEIGEKIVMKEKISFQQLRPLLTFPLFHAGPPVVTGVCKASLAGGTSFLHCDLLPVEDDHGKIQKLVKFFQEKNWAGIVKCPDANRVIFLIPTSQITLDLGITTVDSPPALHVLLFVKKQKTNKGSPVIKSMASGSVREKDSRVVSQIQKELKRQLSVKADAKEKPTEQRRHSLDSARPAVALASSIKDPPNPAPVLQSFEKGLTSEQTVQWKHAVENWLSRPHPLGGTEAELQKTAASSGSVVKAAPLSSSVAHVPKPSRVPAAVTPLNVPVQGVPPRSSGGTEQQRVIPGRQDVHARSSGNAEQHRSGQQADVISRQLNQENVIKKDAKPSLPPLLIRKQEHREDPRLKMRRSLDEEPSTGLKSPNAPQTSHGTPYNAQEALQAQGVKMDSTSTAPVATTPPPPPPSTPPTPHMKYQVNDKSLKELLEKINLPKREEPAYKVTLDDGTRRALEIIKQQDVVKRSKPELQDAKTVTMDTKTDGKLDTSVHTNNEKSVKRSSSSVSATQEKEKRIKTDQANPVSKNLSTAKTEVQTLSSRVQPTKRGESRKGERQSPAERSVKKPLKFSNVKENKNQNDSSSGQEITKPVVKTAVPELVEAPFPKISSLDTLRSPPTSDKMSKAPKLKLILKSRDQKEVSGESSSGDNSESSENKLTKQPKETEHEQKGDLQRDRKSIDSQVSMDEQKGDSQRDRKSIDSPVAMDLSPQCTTPSGSGSVSPITVVSSKGRYHTPVPPTTTLTTPVHSAQAYSTPVTSAFPFTPPLPQGPFRSPIIPCPSQPRHTPAGQQPVHPMPFGPPLSAASSCGTTSLPGVSPMLPSSSMSPVPTGGSVPFGRPIQAASSFAPQSAIPPSPVTPATPVPPNMGAFAGSPSFPPLPPAHPASHQRKNSLDAFPNVPVSSSSGQFPTVFPNAPVSSSAGQFPTLFHNTPVSSSVGQFPTVFPGQQWTVTPPHSQRFGFPTNMPPRPGVVAISPPEVPQWPANSALPRPGLPPPGLPPPTGRPPQVFPQQLGGPSQTAPFPGSPAEMPVVQPHGGGFMPIGAPRFHVPPVLPAGPALPQRGGIPVAPQMAPVHPIFGILPTQLQFQPRIPFQQPAPIGYWEAPLKKPPVPSECGHVGPIHSHSSGQKHSKQSQSTPQPLPQKTIDPGVKKAQKEVKDQKKENSSDAGSEGPKGTTSVQKGVDKEKSNAQLDKQKEVAASKPEVTDAINSKEDKVATASSSDKKETPSKDEEIVSENVEETIVGNEKQLSGNTDDAKVKDSEKLSFDQTSLQHPNKSASKSALSPDSACSKENQNEGGAEGRPCREDSTTQGNKGLAENDGAEGVSSKICIKVEEPCQVTVNELHISSSQDTKEFSSSFGDKHSDVVNVSINGSSANVVEVEPPFCLPTTTYQTEAERKGSNAVSKIYDILRQNAQQSRSETDSADQEEEEELDDPDKPDNPDPIAMDDELNADEEGVTEEEKMLFSGEESTASEQAGHLDTGLRVVQLLELGGIKDNKEKDIGIKESSTFVSNEEHNDGQAQGEIPSLVPLYKKPQETLPMDSEFEDISDVSDEGTPERDLPGYGSVDIEQLWSSKTMDTARTTVPESTATPVEPPKELPRPKAEVERKEADSSSSTRDRHQMRKRHVTVDSQKRKRWESSSKGNDADEYSSSPKRSRKHTRERRSRWESPDRHNTVDSSKKGVRRRVKETNNDVSSPPETNLPPRIVSGFKGGSLQITILRDTKSEEVEVKKEDSNSPETPETREAEEKQSLADMEYSDLEDISPGRLSSDAESPATPDTPETAIPAMDFTHPSLGFWAAPLKTNEMTKTGVEGSAVSEEHEVTGTETLAPSTHLSYLEEHPLSQVEPSQLSYGQEEGNFHKDVHEPYIGKSPWPVEGFFCQTTTSEERDLAGRPIEEDTFVVDDTAGHFLSFSSQESDEDNARYGQEFPQSEVFDYGHGITDRLQQQQQQQQEKPYRSRGHVASRGMQKGIKHRSTNRETRYPWKTREESKHGQMPSAGGEGLMSASQSATGRNIGCDEESSKHPIKKHSVVNAASSTNDSESLGADNMRNWEIYVFALMKKPQLENWIRRKNHGAKLSASGKDQKLSVVFTPESVRRSSARLYRRAKIRLRRACQSPRPRAEDMETSDCLDFDFDDMNLESNCVKESCGSVSKELPQCTTNNANNNVERLNVHSTRIEHPASPGTMENEIVHRDININSNDECSEVVHANQTDDLMCDQEVSIILETVATEEASTSKVVNVGNNVANDSDDGSLTSDLTEKKLSVKAEQHFDVPVADQVTICEEGDTLRNPTIDGEGSSFQQQDEGKESPATKLLESNTDERHQQLNCQDNSSKALDEDKELAHVGSFEGIDNGQYGPSTEQCTTADINSVSEPQLVGGVDLSLNSDRQRTKETPTEEKENAKVREEVLLIRTKDIVAEDVQNDVTASSQAGVVRDTLAVTNVQESHQDPTSVARQSIQETENVLINKGVHSGEDTRWYVKEVVEEKEQTESQRGSDEVGEKKIAFVEMPEPQTEKAPTVSQAADDKAVSTGPEKTTITVTNKSPIMSSVVAGSNQLRDLSNGTSTAQVSTPNLPTVFDSPNPQRPFFNTVPMPIIPVTSHFPTFPPLQGNIMWPVATHADPFAASGMVPAHAHTQQQGNYGYNPTWADHTPHAPFPVGCLPLHSASDDICPPGTESDSLEPSSNPVGFASGTETQETTSKDADEKQPHGSVMDHSVVTALMQFYSEIEDVEGSNNKHIEGFDDSTETVTSVPKAMESAQTTCSKGHEAPADMEIESDHEDSHNVVSEGAEILEIGAVANPVLESTASFDRPSRVEDKTVEVEATETSAKQSPSADGIVRSKVDTTLVESCKVQLDGAETANPDVPMDVTLVDNFGVAMDETLTENPNVAINVTLMKNPGEIIDESLTENPDVALDVTLMKNPDVALDVTLMKNPGVALDETLAENPDVAINVTLIKNSEVTVDETLTENPDVAMDIVENSNVTSDGTQMANPDVAGEKALTNNPGIAVDETLVQNPGIAVDIALALAENPDVALDVTRVDSSNVTTDGTEMANPVVAGEKALAENPGIAVDETLVQNPDITVKIPLAENRDVPIDGKLVTNPDIPTDVPLVESPGIAPDRAQAEKPIEEILAENTDVAMKETPVERPDIAIHRTQVENPGIAMSGTHTELPDVAIMEGFEEGHPLSPIDPLFMASAEQTIFSSIGDLQNLLGQSSTFDLIAEETIASTVSSLEDVLHQAHSNYLELSSCPSDSGASVGEEVSAPSRAFGNIPVSMGLLQDDSPYRIGSVPVWSPSSCLSGGVQPQLVTADARTDERSGTICQASKEKHSAQKKTKKPAGHRKFHFFVYSPEYDRECEAVKNYMLKAGGTFVDVKDSACLEENFRELKVFIRRKHLPSVHRLANLYQLKMSASVRFSLFNTLTDVTEGSRFYENIFVSGGALLADDSILKTIEIDHLDALLRYLKEQSIAHQKFVWVLNVSRNGYKKLSLSKPLTTRDSKVLNLIRQYREEGFITVLQKGYVAENIPSVQRYLQTSLKLQIDLMSVYRHVILLSDMDKNRMEVPWFLERGIGVMNVQEFLTTFAGEREATSLLAKRPNPEATVKETCTVTYCSTPEDDTACQTPEGTPVSDSSTDSPYTDIHAVELPRSTGAPQKRAVRSLSLDAGTMTHRRLQILSCVRSVRDNIRNQISSSSPSSPVSRSM